MLLRLQCNSSYKLNLKGKTSNEYGRNRTRMVWFRGEEH